MSLKLKALGLGLLAMMAMAAFTAMNASATGTGHFTSNSGNEKTVITGTEEDGTAHTTELEVPGLDPITCDHALYEGTVEGNTATSILVTPTYSDCITKETATEVTVDTNECGFRFTVATKAGGDNQVHIECKGATKHITVTHPSCEIRIPAQTVGGSAGNGVAYTTDVLEEKHSLTLDSTVSGITTHFEGGFCVLLGTNKTSNFTGSVTVRGYEDLGAHEGAPYGTEGGRVDITATGSED